MESNKLRIMKIYDNIIYGKETNNEEKEIETILIFWKKLWFQLRKH